MKLALTFLLLLASLLPAADGKSKPGKGSEVKILQVTALRQAGYVLLDGRVLVTSEKPLNGLVVSFDFMATGRQVISTKKTVVSDELLEPEREAEFHVQTVDPVRAVRIQIHCEDTESRDLRVENGGPFPIE